MLKTFGVKKFVYIQKKQYLCTHIRRKNFPEPEMRQTPSISLLDVDIEVSPFMEVTCSHIELSDPQDAAFARMLGGFGEVMSAAKDRFLQCAHEKHIALQQAASQKLPVTNVIADGMQGEVIAILNAMYARGMVTCSKKDWMERMANAMGCPPIADYSRPLNKIKQTYKYESIFDELKSSAIEERDKND